MKSLAARERGGTVDLIVHLAELEARRLDQRAGYSLFAYCREVLLLSEHEAYHRIKAARTARRFPVIFSMLADGAVNLTTVKLLAPHLTRENHGALLQSVRGLGRRDVERMVARLAPQPDVPASVRKLPAPRVAAIPDIVATAAPVTAESAPPAPAPAPDLLAAPPPARPASPTHAALAPLSPDRYKLQLTIDGDTLEQLELARDLLRHALPSGDDAAILKRALTLLVTDLKKRKFAATERPRRQTAGKLETASEPAAGPRPGPAPSASRLIPADVRRAAFVRDDGRCAYVSPDGRRCHERAFVEFHHLRPHAHDGPPTRANIELRCRLCRARHKRHYADCRIMPTDLRWVAMGAVVSARRSA